MLTIRNLLAALALASAFVVTTACSVMPFQPRDNGEKADEKNSSTSREDAKEEAEKPEPETTREVKGADTGKDATESASKGQPAGDDRKVFDNERRRDVELRWLKDR